MGKRLGRWRVGLSGIGFFFALETAAHADHVCGPGTDRPGRGDWDVEMISPRMLHELHLSANLEKKLKEARLAAEKRKIQLFAEKMTLELDLKNLLSNYPVNKSDAMKLAEKIAEADKKLTMLKVEALAQLMDALTADQHTKLQEIQDEWMEKRRAWKEEMRKGWDHNDGKDPKDSD